MKLAPASDKIKGMEEHGIIVECRGATALVKTRRGSSCDSCKSKKACKPLEQDDMLIEVENTIGAKVGQDVIFTVGAGSVIKAGVLFYLVPVLSFIAGVVIGQAVLTSLFPRTNPDLVSGLFGAFLLIVSFIGLKLYNRRISRDNSYRARILRVF